MTNTNANLENIPGGKAGFITFNIILILLIMWGCSRSPKETMDDIEGKYHIGGIVNGEESIDDSCVWELNDDGTGTVFGNGREYDLTWSIISPEKDNDNLALIEVTQYTQFGSDTTRFRIKDEMLLLDEYSK